MKNQRSSVCYFLRVIGATGSVLLGLLPGSARSQLTTAQADQIRNAIGTRVEALTVLGGDFGLAGGSYKSSGVNDIEITVNKFGGSGDIGDPQKLGDLDIGWQPRLQGSMGFVDDKNHFHTGLLNADTSENRSFAIQFGGGARFWLNDRLSLAPTVMGMYGHTSNEYTAVGAFMQANVIQATQLGLVNWDADTWTVRPAVNIQYLYTWDRTIITLSSDPTFFHTESFSTSNSNVRVNGNSWSIDDKIDVDIPLGEQVYGHELRSGGYFSRTELFGDLKDGLNTQHIYEVHGRLVLDFLNQLWKVQWIGVGGSYLWGSNFHGWSAGADVTFRF